VATATDLRETRLRFAISLGFGISIRRPWAFERKQERWGARTCQTKPDAQGWNVQYRLEIKDQARRQLRVLPKEERQKIGRRLNALQTDLAGDVKKLMSKTDEYRLRVGSWRVLFMLESDLISVYAVKLRKEAYD
jgi:mRNA interferase RelE/StbE